MALTWKEETDNGVLVLFHVDLAGLKLALYVRLLLNFQQCSCLPSTRITGVHHHLEALKFQLKAFYSQRNCIEMGLGQIKALMASKHPGF